MNNRLVFLGGTCGLNNWRADFIEALKAKGFTDAEIFDPVVADWNEAAVAAEEKAKKEATHLVFYIADPKQEGNPLSAYSMVEATMALYNYEMLKALYESFVHQSLGPAENLGGPKVVVIFDTAGMAEKSHPQKAMNQTLKVLRKQFPKDAIFATPQESIEWFATLKPPHEVGSFSYPAALPSRTPESYGR